MAKFNFIETEIEGVYIIYFKPKKESIIRVIEVLGDENEISNKLSCLKKDISLNLVDAEIFTGYYPINISFWDGGFYLLQRFTSQMDKYQIQV